MDEFVLQISEHLGIDDLEWAEVVADKIANSGLSTEYLVFKKSDILALEEFQRHLLGLGQSFSTLTEPAGMLLHIGVLTGRTEGGFPSSEVEEHRNMVGEPMFEAMNKLIFEPNYIYETATRVKKIVEQSKDLSLRSSRINLQAVQIVSVADRFWRQYREEPVPENLNMASPFGRFLACLFDEFEIQGNERSAFVRWKAMTNSAE